MQKYNPFRPDKIVPPGMFYGRVEEIEYIEHCLLQAKHNNSKHFIIDGERGIGKSSLFLYTRYVATGSVEIASGEFANFVTVDVSLTEDDSWYSIVRKIASSLESELNRISIFRAETRKL
ncbi:MAG: ATP-binding protein [Hyphomicrobiales bacterium]|nr:ATP-binding protein [Hyphomicrobiales bacterium]